MNGVLQAFIHEGRRWLKEEDEVKKKMKGGKDMHWRASGFSTIMEKQMCFLFTFH